MLGRSDGVLNRTLSPSFSDLTELTPFSLLSFLLFLSSRRPVPHACLHGLTASGIRFGSSELYEVLDTFSPSAPVLKGASPAFNIIEDSLVVGQKTLDGADERVVLFVKLVGEETLGDELLKEIKTRIRST